MQKVKLLLILVVFIAMTIPSMGQAWEKERGPAMQYDGVFADTSATGEILVSGGHGIAVDKYDRVWIGNYYGAATGGIVVLNPDGTPADFSPIASVTVGDTTIAVNITGSCRGINVDHEGNILYAHGAALIKINVENGQGMALWVHSGSLLKPAVDAEGYIYCGKVVGVNPVVVLDPATFQPTQEITLANAPSYARGLEVSPDGKTLIPANLAAGPIFIYTTDDYVTYSLTDSIMNDVMGNPIFMYQCVTVDWDRDGKLWISHDNAYGTRGDNYNGFVIADLANKKISYLEIPMDSTEFNGPRGIAFNSAGDVAYATSFTASKVYKFSAVELRTPGEWTFNDRVSNWLYDGIWADTLATGEMLVSAGHGVAVDKYDRVWIGSYYAANTGGIVVLNPDGTPTDFSPIASVTVGDTTIAVNITGSCRGINVDHEGNILYAHGAALIKINVENGEGMALWVHSGSLLKPAVDAEGYIYCGKVVGVNPVVVLDPATFLPTQEITLANAPSYARGLEVTSDGKTLIPSNLAAGPIFIYTTDDYVTYSLTDSILNDTEGYPVFQYQCVTVDWGPDGKLWVSHDDAYGAKGNIHNGFVVVDLETKEYDYRFVPLDSTEYNGPRGIAFNNAGDVAYFVSFNAPRVWKFTKSPVTSVEIINGKKTPKEYILGQNYPNPFNPTTTIPFSVKQSGMVEIKVYDILGREVRTLVNNYMGTGNYKTIFDAAGLATGIYHYRITVNGVSQTKRMLLLK